MDAKCLLDLPTTALLLNRAAGHAAASFLALGSPLARQRRAHEGLVCPELLKAVYSPEQQPAEYVCQEITATFRVPQASRSHLLNAPTGLRFRRPPQCLSTQGCV